MAAPRFQRYETAVAADAAGGGLPEFRRLTSGDIMEVNRILTGPFRPLSRTCDYSIGGIFMWTDYFDYTFSVFSDTLFIKGVTENNITDAAFSLPAGALPLKESIELLRRYCADHDGLQLKFSAVPADRIDELRSLGATLVEPLDDWADYLYSASSLATLAGKKMSKKRNHVNRFMADNPDYRLEPLGDHNIAEVLAFLDSKPTMLTKPVLADVERMQTRRVLENLKLYPMMEGAVLRTAGKGPVAAFAVGEVIGDTLYEHIEKIDHEISGAGETICHLFAAMMTARHPEIMYVNREEDTGDPGLRYAKESLHPLEKIRKFNVVM